jgi:hypothetical protein
VGILENSDLSALPRPRRHCAFAPEIAATGVLPRLNRRLLCLDNYTLASALLTISATFRPGRRRFSSDELLWLAFVVVQALDGSLSYVGVLHHGLAIEANPLVAWYLAALGPAAGFAAAKLFAVTCGAVLYLTGRFYWVAILTLVYLVAAIFPWIGLLSVHI